MSVDSNLRIQIISLLLGESFQPYVKEKGGKAAAAATLSVEEFHLRNLTGRRSVQAAFIDEKNFFDPQFDHDFSNLCDSSRCMRGDEEYERPKGWYRIALKVKGKYPDGDAWLGTNGWRSQSVPGEWPVSYHGTTLKGARGIIKSHYSAGERALYGRGIYSTPDPSIAERYYAQTFTSETTGKRYKVILQNRINPRKREICNFRDYWLIPVPKGTSAEKERDIVESSIRPYGILIKELKHNDDHERNKRNATSDIMIKMRVLIEVFRLFMSGTISTIKLIFTVLRVIITTVIMIQALVETGTKTMVRTTKTAWKITVLVLMILMIVMKCLMKMATVVRALVKIFMITMLQTMKVVGQISAPLLVKLMTWIKTKATLTSALLVTFAVTVVQTMRATFEEICCEDDDDDVWNVDDDHFKAGSNASDEKDDGNMSDRWYSDVTVADVMSLSGMMAVIALMLTPDNLIMYY